jgi:mono/diheme cytochrome c family protein
MKKLLKWLGILVALFVVIVLIAAIAINMKSKSALNQKFSVNPEHIEVSQDSAVLARGKYITHIICASCHGHQFEGKWMIEDDVFGHAAAPNISGATGSPTANYKMEDWVRSIRHAVSPEGRGLMIMPAHNYIHFSEADLSAIVSYMMQVPAVEKEWPEAKWGPMGKMLIGTGQIPNMIPAAEIDHDMDFPADPESDPVSNGRYLTTVFGCSDCHGANLNGAETPDPTSPISSNLTPAGNLGNWNDEDFIHTMRTGVTPEGKTLNNDYMPWQGVGQATDEDLASIFAYLSSIDALENGYE